MSNINLKLITADGINQYLQYIPSDELSDIIKGHERAIGLLDDDINPVGAMVTATGKEPDDGPGHILVIRNLYLTEEFRTVEIIEKVVSLVGKLAKAEKHAGVVWEVLSPDSADLEEVLSSRCVRLQDGNTFYEGAVENFIYCPVVKKDFRELTKKIISVDKLSKKEYAFFLHEMETRFPSGLDIAHLPGKWLPNLSYVYRNGEETEAYILSSEISENMIYIGAIYVKKHGGILAGALIGHLARVLIENMYYEKVMFTAASGEGAKLCEFLTRGIKKIIKREIHNYYEEV